MASRQLSSTADIINAIRQIDDTVSKLSMKVVDFHGRRITNAAASQNSNDYVIRKEMIEGLARVSAALNILAQGVDAILSVKNNDAFFDKGRITLLKSRI